MMWMALVRYVRVLPTKTMAMSATAVLLSTAPSACLFQPIMLQYNLGKIQGQNPGAGKSCPDELIQVKFGGGPQKQKPCAGRMFVSGWLVLTRCGPKISLIKSSSYLCGLRFAILLMLVLRSHTHKMQQNTVVLLQWQGSGGQSGIWSPTTSRRPASWCSAPCACRSHAVRNPQMLHTSKGTAATSRLWC